jgi:outer membrane lipoprotein carrier protein
VAAMKFMGLFLRLLAGFLVLSMAADTLAAGKPASLKDVVAALENGYAGLQDVQADFSQTTNIAAVSREQKGAGEVFLKRPSSAAAMFRFNYAKPKQQIISNGKQVWFYLPDNRQVMVSPVSDMFKGGNSIALNYLTGLGNVSRDFSTSFAKDLKDDNGNYKLELIPHKTSPVLSKLQLTVSLEAVEQFTSSGSVKDTFPVISSIVYDAGGNQTRIDYSRVRVNRGLDNGKFNFKIPAGVEVIKP